MRRGFTLIEMLIVVAIVAILAASLAFSFTQIVTRSVMAERRFRMDEAMAVFADALAADVAQCSSREAVGGSVLRLALAPSVRGEPRSVEYRLEAAGLVRSMWVGPRQAEVNLFAEGVSGEVAAGADGASLEITAHFRMGLRTVSRRVTLFAAWPETLLGGAL